MRARYFGYGHDIWAFERDIKEALAEKANIFYKLEKTLSDLSKSNEKIESKSAIIKEYNLKKKQLKKVLDTMINVLKIQCLKLFY